MLIFNVETDYNLLTISIGYKQNIMYIGNE